MLKDTLSGRNLGQYLLNRDLLTADQVYTILATEQKSRIKLEVAALCYGLLTAKQVKRIQMLKTLVNKRFGDIAIECGYLTEDQLEDLLNLPENDNLNFSQAVLDYAYMNLNELESACKEFCASAVDKEFTNTEPPRLNADIPDAFSGLYCKYIHFLLCFLARLLQAKNITIGHEAVEAPENYMHLSQKFNGDSQFYTVLKAEKETFLKIAAAYSKETFSVFDALAADSLQELFNLNNGLFAVHLSSQGLNADLEPVIYKEMHVVPRRYTLLKTEFGDLLAALFVKHEHRNSERMRV